MCKSGVIYLRQCDFYDAVVNQKPRQSCVNKLAKSELDEEDGN